MSPSQIQFGQTPHQLRVGVAFVRQLCLHSFAALTFLASTSQSARAVDGQLLLKVIDHDTEQPTACRLHLKTAAGKPVKIPGAVAHADHVVFFDQLMLKLPLGSYQFTLERGPETLIRTGHFTINRYADDSETVDVKRFINMAENGWYPGDLDIQRSPDELPLLMQAEGLNVAVVTTWTNDKSHWTKTPLPASPVGEHPGHRLIDLMGGEDSRQGSAMILAGLKEPLKLPANKAAWPALASTAAAAHQNNGWVDAARPFARELPIWIAAGQVDSVQLANRHQRRDGVLENEAGGRPRSTATYGGAQGNGRWSQDIYYQLLEAGLRIPPTAGSGSGTNSNPVGYNRIYAYVDGELTLEKWWAAVRAGKVVVTNGPLLQCKVDGHPPGYVFKGDAGKTVELLPELTLSTRDKINYLEIVMNGKVIDEVRLDKYKANGGKLDPIKFKESGWCLIRAVTTEQNSYRFATTAPFFVEIDYKPRISRAATRFFLDWVEDSLRMFPAEEAKLTAEQKSLRALWLRAKVYWQERLTKANAD